MLRRWITVSGCLLAMQVWITATQAQEFRYQFQDQPYPEANVVLVQHKIVPGESNEWYLEGRVFNRGIKPAKNVRVVFTRGRSGARMPGNTNYFNPGEVPGTKLAFFRERLPQLSDSRDVYVTVNVEWDK